MGHPPSRPQQEGFKLSQLLYDKRYRSITIQIFALIAILTLFGWLINNAVINLAALGKPIQFSFLGDPASYDINQRLIEYNSRMSHFRAAMVGLLNTLLVAFLGCVTATFIGVMVGILRLSKNWLIARLMTYYVEIFRNIPVLLWILITLAVFIYSMPKPKEFRGGEDAAAQFVFGGSTAFSNQGIYIPRLMGSDYDWLFLLSLLLSGVGIWFLNRWAMMRQNTTGSRPRTFPLKLLVVLAPLLAVYFGVSSVTSKEPRDILVAGQGGETSLQALAADKTRLDLCFVGGATASKELEEYLIAADVTFRRKTFVSAWGAELAFADGVCDVLSVKRNEAAAQVQTLQSNTEKTLEIAIIASDHTTGPALRVDYPTISQKGIPRFEGGTQLRNSLIALWFALSLYTAAFIAEAVRAGIMAISRGQTEAAYALGIRPGRTMRLVILPQALRVIIPPLISNYLNLTKNSSLAIAVGYMDITGTLGGITLNQSGREMESILLLMLCYLTISLTLSAVINWYNERVKLKER